MKLKARSNSIQSSQIRDICRQAIGQGTHHDSCAFEDIDNYSIQEAKGGQKTENGACSPIFEYEQCQQNNKELYKFNSRSNLQSLVRF